MPERPEGLPTAEELAERRRRLEADLGTAKGGDTDATPRPLSPEPLPELSETMQDIPVARASTGLVAGARPGVSVQVATVFFAAGSDDLDEQMIDVLSQVAREQQSIGGGVRVVGHGGTGASADLSQRQMAAIGQTLIRMGVPPTRIGTELGTSGGGGEADHGHAVIYLDY